MKRDLAKYNYHKIGFVVASDPASCHRRGLVDAVQGRPLVAGSVLRLTSGNAAHRHFLQGYMIGTELIAGRPITGLTDDCAENIDPRD
jgi:hypothetical protein